MASFLALSLIEMLVLIALFFFLIVGTGYDRNGRAGVKWVAIIALVGGWALFHNWSGSFWDMAKSFLSSDFWLPALTYFAFGLIIYSPIEFRFEIKGSARRMTKRWEEFLEKNPKVRARKLMSAEEMRIEAEQKAEEERLLQEQRSSIVGKAKQLIEEAGIKLDRDAKNLLEHSHERRREEPTAEQKVAEFVEYANRRQYGYVSDIIRLKADGVNIDTSIYRPGLVQSIACWTFMWPAYAASLVLGNFVVEFFETVVDMTQKWANERLKKAFAEVFAVK